MARIHHQYRGRLLACVCLASLTMAIAPAAAQQPTEISIPAQPAADAITQLGRQTGTQILFDHARLKNIRTNAVTGATDPQQALRQMLAGTGLEIGTTPSGALTVKAAPGELDAGQGPAAAPSAEGDDREIVVTGTRLGIAREDSPLPVRVHNRRDIEASGQTTVAGFLNTLPEVSIPAKEGGLSTNSLWGSPVRLYGLPAGMTLTLLNGRRMQQSQGNSVNLTNIPQALVDRIELLPVGGSAVYGSDALGGGVNIILKRRMRGISADVQYGHAKGYDEVDASLATGFEGERGGIALLLNHHWNNALYGKERHVFRTTEVPPYFDGLGDYSCTPGTVYSLDGQPLGIPGSSATWAAIPEGISGRPAPSDFSTTAGQVRHCNDAADAALEPRSTRYGIMLLGDYDLTPDVQLFTELLASSNNQSNSLRSPIFAPGGEIGYTRVPADNPFNPFGKPVGLSGAFPVAKGGWEQKTRFYRALLGLRGGLGDWSYELTASYSHDRTKVHSFDGAYLALQAALNVTDPAMAFNPFNPTAPASQDTIDQILSSTPSTRYQYKNGLTTVQAFVRTPTARLPIGAVSAVLGGEYSNERQRSLSNIDFVGTPPDTPFEAYGRQSYALFGEAFFPLSANGQGDTNFSLTVAGRYDHADDFGGEFTYQAGLLWKPFAIASLRANYGTAYRAPPLERLHRPVTVSPNAPITDPFRGGQEYPVNIITGGNPNLDAETGVSKTLGLTLSPFADRSLVGNIDWFSVEIDNYISVPHYYALIANPDLVPGSIVRDAPTAQDMQQGYPGLIRDIYARFVNYGKLNAEGINFDLSYRLSTSLGSFTPAVSGVYMTQWDSAITPGAPQHSYLGQASDFGPGFAPRFRGTASLNWARGPVQFRLAGRYVSSYRDSQDRIPNDNRLGGYWQFDTNIGVQLGELASWLPPLLSDSALQLGATNLTNKLPEFSAGRLGYDTLADRRGRFLYLRLSVKR